MAVLTWISGGLLGALGIALAIGARGAGRGSDAAGRGLAAAYVAFAALLWLVLAGLFGLGLASGARWLTAAPLLVVVVPAAVFVLAKLRRALFRVRSRMPTRGLRALERAAADGHATRAKEILASGVKIPDVETGRALLVTALVGAYARDVVDVLLEAGADPRSAGLLELAMESRHTTVVPFVKHGASPDTVLPPGDTLAFRAMDRGQMDVVEALVEAGADPNQKDRNGWPLILAHAAGKRGFGPGNWIYVRRLLDRGADPSVPGPDGTTLRDVFAKAGPYDLHPDHAEALRARLG